MTADPEIRRCPSCAKPLRPDAANCWFCGTVFGIVRCVGCGSPNRTGSPACQICGEELPVAVVRVAASDAPPTAPRAAEQDCPECGGPVPLAAILCKHCGAELNSPTRTQAVKWSGATIRRSRGGSSSRGGSIAVAAVFSFVWLLPVGIALVIFFAMGGRGLRSEFLVALACGLLPCTAGVVIAFLDLKGMRMGRMNADGYTRTLVGGVMNGFTVVLYWGVIMYCIFSGL
ncbi:MAG: double zinc ribbon domain-containing protein [Armatimonadaceae bacterium]